jgi:hypothetical protein
MRLRRKTDKVNTVKGLTVLHRTCNYCKEHYCIVVEEEAHDRWKAGALIQDAFPNLSIDQREAIMTGYHSECFDKAVR